MSTDYERIAARYDDDRRHSPSRPDAGLGAMCARASRRVRLLDVGCGTGRYLATQLEHVGSHALGCVGVDPSPAMLAPARRRLPPGSLVRGTAERLPFRDAAFDCVVSGRAFHHFADKRRAVSDIARVLRPGGRLTLRNIDPWRMTRWWVYRLFEGTWEADQRRFWRVEALVEELRRLGFTVEATVDHATSVLPASDVLARAEARVISQLAILDDGAYREGLAGLRATAGADPATTVESESATATVTAVRAGT